MRAAVTARDEAEQEAAEAAAKVETLTRKLATAGGRKRGGKVTANRATAGGGAGR